MKIAVFGLGFVGLTTAVGFAKKGFEVFGYEIDENKAKALNELKIPFYEKDLDSALKDVLGVKLKITSDIKEALKNAKIIFYCIGTPMSDDGSADLSYLLKALKDTVENLSLCDKIPILVIKSTVPPSSCKDIFIPFIENLGLKLQKDYRMANNPEFLREGFAYDDFINPDRIVIGTDNAKPINELELLYKAFNAELFFTSLNTAEFIKYLSNTTLSLNISYANEMSIIASSIGDINIIQSFKILHKDKRFSGNPAGISSYLYPGMGFGGYCLPKDTLALYKKAKDKGYEAKILKDILAVNEEVINFYANKLKNELSQDENIGILGLSFKPQSDDVRDSKSATFIKKLLELGFRNIYAYDPMANEIFKKTYDFNISYEDSLQNIKDKCKILVIATAWEEFSNVLNEKDKKIYNFRYMKGL